jgi:hypothetical protein
MQKSALKKQFFLRRTSRSSDSNKNTNEANKGSPFYNTADALSGAIHVLIHKGYAA